MNYNNGENWKSQYLGTLYEKHLKEAGLNFDDAIEEMPSDYMIKKLLVSHKAEVRDMLLTEYNEQETMELFRRDGIREGVIKGETSRMEKDARGMYAAGLKPEAIAKIQDIPVSRVNKILGLMG